MLRPLLLTALLLALCGGPTWAEDPLTDLSGPDQARALFNEGVGAPRLWIFLSPT